MERQAELRALIAPRATAEEPTVAAPDPAQVEAALTRIAALKGLPMEQIVERIREPELVQDMQLVLEAQDALRQQPDSPQATRDLGALTYRLSDLGDLTHALELQVRITQGNERLRAMSEAVRAERWDALRREGARVDRLVETMRGHEREVFHRNAEALRERAAALLEKGQRLEQLGARASGLRVQALLTGEGTSLAVISGRVYAEGAEILDEDGREQEPPLRVVRVSRSVVTLDLGGTEFVRELGQ